MTSHKAQGFVGEGGAGSVKAFLSFEALLGAFTLLPEEVAIGGGSC